MRSRSCASRSLAPAGGEAAAGAPETARTPASTASALLIGIVAGERADPHLEVDSHGAPGGELEVARARREAWMPGVQAEVAGRKLAELESARLGYDGEAAGSDEEPAGIRGRIEQEERLLAGLGELQLEDLARLEAAHQVQIGQRHQVRPGAGVGQAQPAAHPHRGVLGLEVGAERTVPDLEGRRASR